MYDDVLLPYYDDNYLIMNYIYSHSLGYGGEFKGKGEPLPEFANGFAWEEVKAIKLGKRKLMELNWDNSIRDS